MTNLSSAILDPLMATNPAGPRVTYYDDATGERIEGPAKRGMDPLETQVDEQGRVSVRFRRFKQDSASREEV